MDADAAFANSFVPLLKTLEPRGNREAKIEIQQVVLGMNVITTMHSTIIRNLSHSKNIQLQSFCTYLKFCRLFLTYTSLPNIHTLHIHTIPTRLLLMLILWHQVINNWMAPYVGNIKGLMAGGTVDQ